MDFFMLCLFTFLLFLRPMDFVAGLDGLQLLDVTGLAAFLFISHRVQRGPHNLLIIGFLSCGLLSHAVRGYFLGCQQTFIFFAKIAVLYLAVANAVNSQDRLKGYLTFLCVLCAILAVNSLGQLNHGVSYFGGVEPLKVPILNDYSEPTGKFDLRIRGVGIFNDPNDLGQMLVLGLIMAYGFITTSSSLLSRVTYFSFLPIFTLGIYHTNSRGTLLALAAAIGYYALRNTRNLFPKVFGIISIVLLFLFGPSRAGAMTPGSSTDRLELWSSAITLFKGHPLFGVGVGMFQDVTGGIMTAHQSYLLVLSEMGLFGYFFWFGMIFLFFHTVSNVRRILDVESPEEKKLLAVLKIVEAAVFGFLVSAYFLSRSYQFPLFVFLGLGPAFAVITKRVYPDYRMYWGTQEWCRLGLCTMGSTLFLYLATKVLWNVT